MPRIEELPDDFDASLDISEPSKPSQTTQPPKLSSASIPTSSPTHNGTTDPSPNPHNTTPALPPSFTSPAKDRPLDDFLADLNRHPLFMTSLDESDGKGGVNVELEGLKALAYEGTPEEVAANFKEQGNEMFQERRWRDAREFYDRGLVVLVDTRRKREGKERKRDKEDNDGGLVNGEAELLGMDYQQGNPTTQLHLEETLLINRAACNFELQNHRMVTRDTLAALALNPQNLKAHYRLSLALLSLSKIPEAREAVHHGLTVSPANKPLQTLRDKISARATELETHQRAAHDRQTRLAAEKHALRLALHSRGILVRHTSTPPPLPPSSQTSSPPELTLSDPLSPTSTLSIPALILYPLVSQTDFIAALPTNTTLGDHLSYILPPPWNDDPEVGGGEYGDVGAVRCLMRTGSGGLVQVGKKVSVEGVLDSRGKEEGKVVEVLDGVLQVIVVPRGRVEGWVEEYKRKVGKTP
ncbi:MAG: hypothetical protein M1817_002004 [Caeruleum heppii]|nr:MAG: hypothetical protein M1817_002004 [Caeruleum heppii]